MTLTTFSSETLNSSVGISNFTASYIAVLAHFLMESAPE